MSHDDKNKHCYINKRNKYGMNTNEYKYGDMEVNEYKCGDMEVPSKSNLDEQQRVFEAFPRISSRLV